MFNKCQNFGKVASAIMYNNISILNDKIESSD